MKIQKMLTCDGMGDITGISTKKNGTYWFRRPTYRHKNKKCPASLNSAFRDDVDDGILRREYYSDVDDGILRRREYYSDVDDGILRREYYSDVNITPT